MAGFNEGRAYEQEVSDGRLRALLLACYWLSLPKTKQPKIRLRERTLRKGQAFVTAVALHALGEVGPPTDDLLEDDNV